MIAGESRVDESSEPSRRLTRNLDAWKAHLRGVFQTNRPDISDDTIRTATGHFQRAVAFDPEFAIAHAKLLATPAHFSAQSLRLDPRWDPLRAHPRYRAPVETDPSP